MKELNREEMLKVEGGSLKDLGIYIAGKVVDKALDHLSKKSEEIASGKVTVKPSPVGCTSR